MDRNENIITQLLEEERESNIFFSNRDGCKRRRERSLCMAFLRGLGIDFCEEDIKSCDSDPPDVIFGQARFEIFEETDKKNRRHAEIKNRIKILEETNDIRSIMEHYNPPTPLSYIEIADRINKSQILKKKLNKYSINNNIDTKTIDILIYMNLKNRYLDTSSDILELDENVCQNWRSISVFINPKYSYVFYAAKSAPCFIRSCQKQTMAQWSDFNTIFDIKI